MSAEILLHMAINVGKYRFANLWIDMYALEKGIASLVYAEVLTPETSLLLHKLPLLPRDFFSKSNHAFP